MAHRTSSDLLSTQNTVSSPEPLISSPSAAGSHFPTHCLILYIPLFNMDTHITTACDYRMAGYHYNHYYFRWASAVTTYAPPQYYVTIPRQLSLSAPYYGFEPIARLCDRFIRSLFSLPQSHGQQSLPQFIAYTLYRSQVHASVTYSSLILLRRLQKYHPQANGMAGEQLFITTLIIAAKILNDRTYNNTAWVTVSRNQFTHEAINEMERQMCGYLKYKLAIFGPMLEVFEEAVKRDFNEDRTSYPSYSNDMVSPRRKEKKKTIKRLVLVPAEARSADYSPHSSAGYAPCASGYAHTAALEYTSPAPSPADPSYQPGQSRRRRYTSLVPKMPMLNIRQATIPVSKIWPPDSTPVIPAVYPAADTWYQPRRRRCNSVIPMPMPNVRQPSIQMPSRKIELPSAPVIPFLPVFAPTPVCVRS